MLRDAAVVELLRLCRIPRPRRAEALRTSFVRELVGADTEGFAWSDGAELSAAFDRVMRRLQLVDA